MAGERSGSVWFMNILILIHTVPPFLFDTGYLSVLVASMPFLTPNQKFLLIWFTLCIIYVPLRGTENILLCKPHSVAIGKLSCSKSFTIVCHLGWYSKHFNYPDPSWVLGILRPFQDFFLGEKVLSHFYSFASALC